jgi:hypothetical protein
MSPDQIRAAIKVIDGEIIGLKKSGRRNYGTTHKGLDTKWPDGALAALEVRKCQAKEYRRMLAECESVTA